MTPHPLLAGLLAGALLSGAPVAPASASAHDLHADETAALARQHDPFAPVFIVASQATWRGGLQSIARDPVERVDSLGSRVVVARIRTNQLAEVSHLVHEREKRCGGYFAFPTRAAADWIRDTWLSMAGERTDVSAELFTACGNCSTQPSVILTVQGTEMPDEVVVLGGHLDSISWSGSGDGMDAPGADDDASGIATLTEVIRIALASGWQPRRTVKFMGYAAEEVGLRGSNAIAQSFQDQGVDVVGVLQLDMTNYAVGASDDMQLVTDYSNAGLQQFVRDVFDEYLAPLGLTRGTYACGYACSDHASWTSAGFPSAMMFEAGFNNDIHTPDDTLANMGGTAAPSVALAKLGLGFLGELAKTSGGDGGENQPPVADFTAVTDGLSVVLTDASTDGDGNITARSWDFGDGSGGTDANPVHTYAAAGTYDVTLTATDDDGASSSRTRSVTVDAGGSGDGVLTRGVPETGLSGSSGEALHFTLDVPSGASDLVFAMSGGSGDADLYVKFGSAPTDSSWDCRPYRYGNEESCAIASPSPGTWHVRIKGYSAFSGVSLVGDHAVGGDGGGDGTQTYANATVFAIGDYATVYSPVTVSGRGGQASASTQVDVDVRHTYIGDLRVDLIAPDGSVYPLHNRSGGSTDNIIRAYTVDLSSEGLDGTWRLRATDRGRGDTGRLESWSVTF